MAKDARTPLIEILETASNEGLPHELAAGENVPDVSIYHDLIDHGYLMGTILSDGRRPYFIESCHITAKGREYLMQLKQEVRQKPLSWTWYFKPFLIGCLVGAVVGIILIVFWIRDNGLPVWLK
ncbi:MAG: hypothetical protein HOH33_02700 [Verrucomicrobia bacterium]|jgi:hypothetical protein|nr:hypothetical protein [Verrucomicrobiota bacterium]